MIVSFLIDFFVDQVVSSYDVYSLSFKSAGQILAANVCKESHFVLDNDWLEEPN